MNILNMFGVDLLVTFVTSTVRSLSHTHMHDAHGTYNTHIQHIHDAHDTYTTNIQHIHDAHTHNTHS